MHDHNSHNHSSKNIGTALLLNLGFAIFEIFMALWSNSLAVLSNSLHDFGDSFSLGLSWFFDKLSKKGRNDSFSYGKKRFSLIPVVINSVILLLGSLYIIYEAIGRIMSPQQTKVEGMILFAVIGITINLIAYLRLSRGKSLNEKAASLHLLDDVLGLSSVLVISIVMKFYYAPVLDPILSVVITLFVLTKIFQNLKTANLIFLQAIPSEIKIKELEEKLKNIKAVKSIHDMHIWSLDGLNHIITVHLVVQDNLSFGESVKIKCEARTIIERFGINHPTIEIEPEKEVCNLCDC